MSFSEYFSEYVKSNDISIPKLSKATGIDRAALYRYINADRLPKTIETVELIADGMCMSSKDRVDFLFEYDKSTLGEDLVNSYLYMHYLLDNLVNIDRFIESNYELIKNQTIKELFDDDRTVDLKSSHEIINYAMRMFYRCAETSESDKNIKLAIQPTYTYIMELLLPFFSQKEIKVEQVICFEKSIEKCYINLDILKYMLPLSFGLSDYNVYYHYDSISSHLNSTSILPNLIITSGCALMFDYEMQSGFFTTDKNLVDHLTSRFADLSGQCFTLMEKGSCANNIAHINSAVAGFEVGSLFNQPCIAPCMDSTMLHELIYDFPHKNSLIEALLNRYGNWEGMIHSGSFLNVRHITSCFTKNGMRKMIETGRIGEFPEIYYAPISKSYISDILKRMLVLINTGMCSYIIIREDLKFPETMQIYWNPTERTVSFRYVRHDTFSQCTIKETSIYNAILNAIEYIDLKKMVLSKEECVEYINELISELSVADE